MFARPFIYGLAIAGKLGARDVMRGLLAVSVSKKARVGICSDADADTAARNSIRVWVWQVFRILKAAIAL